jgi:hypothetical protein
MIMRKVIKYEFRRNIGVALGLDCGHTEIRKRHQTKAACAQCEALAQA